MQNIFCILNKFISASNFITVNSNQSKIFFCFFFSLSLKKKKKMALTKAKGPSQKFEMLIRILRSLASICGVDMLQKKLSHELDYVYSTVYHSVQFYGCMFNNIQELSRGLVHNTKSPCYNGEWISGYCKSCRFFFGKTSLFCLACTRH